MRQAPDFTAFNPGYAFAGRSVTMVFEDTGVGIPKPASKKLGLLDRD